MVKSWKGGGEKLKRLFFVWHKLKIETKMREGKYRRYVNATCNIFGF
jgi:hypothetical protein